MGGEITETSAYSDLEAVFQQLEAFEKTGGEDFDASKYSVRVNEPVGELGGRQVTVKILTTIPEAHWENISDFVRARFEVLYPGQDVSGKVADFLNLKKPTLPERNIVVLNESPENGNVISTEKIVPGDKSVSAAKNLDREHVAEQVARLGEADVRQVASADLDVVKNVLTAFAKRHADVGGLAADIAAVTTALGKVKDANKTLGKQDGRQLALSWIATEERAPGAAINAKTEFVEAASAACEDAAAAVTEFINRYSEQLNTEPELLERLDTLTESLSLYAGDIVRLAVDMAELLRSVHEEVMRRMVVKRELPLKDIEVSSLKPKFTDFIGGKNKLGEKDSQDFLKRLNGIVDAADELFRLSGEDGKAGADLGTLTAQVSKLKVALDGLESELHARRGSHFRVWKPLISRIWDTRQSLGRWLYSYGKSCGGDQTQDAVSLRERFLAEADGLRQRDVLKAVFEGTFDVEFYLRCRNRGIAAEQIDFSLATSRIGTIANLGSGANNSVYKVMGRKVGYYYEDTHAGVFKEDSSANRLYDYDIDDNCTDFSSFFYGYHRGYNALNVNFAAHLLSDKWLGVPKCVVRAHAGYTCTPNSDTKRFGVMMDMAPGRSLNDEDRLREDFGRYGKRDQQAAAIEILLKGNDLDWSDWLSGQYDRHGGNIMLDLGTAPDGPVVGLCGIDNDGAFPAKRIGLDKFKLTEENYAKFATKTNDVRAGKNDARFEELDMAAIRQLEKSGAIVHDHGSVLIDRSKFPPKYIWLFYEVMGLNSARRPSFITTQMLGKLRALREQIDAPRQPGQPDPFERDFGRYLPADAIAAMRLRFEELYAHALDLERMGRVVDAQALRGYDPVTKSYHKTDENTLQQNLSVILSYVGRGQYKADSVYTANVAQGDVYDTGLVVLGKLKFWRLFPQMEHQLDSAYIAEMEDEANRINQQLQAGAKTGN